jgi:hypothetical protein
MEPESAKPCVLPDVKIEEPQEAQQNGLPAQSARKANSIKQIMLRNTHYYILQL